MHDDDLDSIFLNSFLKEYNNTTEEKTQFVKESRMIADMKRKKLEPIGSFLQKFVDLGVQVYHRDTFDKTFASVNFNTVVPFDYFEATSSKGWEPGISICFDHPAQIEIAVPNHDEEGMFVVNLSTEHPDVLILKQKFLSIPQLCQALAIFIQKSTVSIEENPKDAISTLENKIRFDGSTIKQDEQKRLEKQNNNRYTEKDSEPQSSSTLSKIGEYFKKNKDEE